MKRRPSGRALLACIPKRAGAAIAATAAALALIPAAANALPDGYVYEKVSPAHKGNGEVMGGGAPTGFRLSADGDRALYPMDSRILGAPPLILNNTYFAERDAMAWRNGSLNGIRPFGLPFDWFLSPNQPTNMYPPDVSDDGRKVLLGSNLDPDTGEVGPSVLYLVDGSTGMYERVSPPPLSGAQSIPEMGTGIVRGTYDYSSVYFRTSSQLTADAPASGNKIYRWRDKGLSLASIGPDGTHMSSNMIDQVFSAQNPTRSNPVSENGDVLLFNSAVGNQIYRRDMAAQTTDFVNGSENTGTTVPAGAATFRGSSPDGEHVVFMSNQRLVDEVDQLGSGTNVYRYSATPDPVTGRHLTLVSRDGESADGTDVHVADVLGTSEDTSVIYFTSENRLTPTAPVTPGPKIYRWDEGEIEYLASASATPTATWATPEGELMNFRSNSAGLTPEDNGGLMQLYVYDHSIGEISCASCRTDGEPSQYPVVTPPIPFSNIMGFKSRRWMATTGRVFFMTDEPLLPDDTNGSTDIYSYYEGELNLITPGREAARVRFADASADGSTVAFMTDERLNAWDTDDKSDLYVARLHGGLAGPDLRPEEPCAGDECQESQAGAPMLPDVGSRDVASIVNAVTPRGRACDALQRRIALVKRKRVNVQRRTSQLRRTTNRFGQSNRAAGQATRLARRSQALERRSLQLDRRLGACRERGR